MQHGAAVQHLHISKNLIKLFANRAQPVHLLTWMPDLTTLSIFSGARQHVHAFAYIRLGVQPLWFSGLMTYLRYAQVLLFYIGRH